MSLSKRLRGLWWNRSFRRWVVMSLLLYTASIELVSAVQPDLTPVFTYHSKGVGTCEWLIDNTLQITNRLNYRDYGAEQFSYNPQTQHLSSQGGFNPAFSFLTPMNRILPAMFKREIYYSQGNEFYASPDGRFVVYPVAISSDADLPYTFLNLLDRKSWQSTIISDVIINPYATTIQWAIGSNAFVIIKQGEYGSGRFMNYVTGFASALSSLKVTEISGYSETNVDTMLQWTLYQVHDIDSSGQFILADGYFHETEDHPDQLRLIIINMHDLSYELVEKDGFFVTARFEQPGDQRVFYFNLNGIFVYDRTSKTTELLNDDVADLKRSYSRTCQPTISPDGRFIAFDDDDETNEVIVVPIKEP
jgi:hypothetical protein